jgi:hypothetical protein
MNLEYKELLPTDFHPQSRVWIYQSNRLFSLKEALEIEEGLEKFAQSWKSHGAPVKAYANLFFGQFIVLMADESDTTVGGCSTDSSVHFIKELEQRFGVSLFDRQLLAFFIKDKIQLIPLAQLNYAVEKGFIDKESLYFNNTVLTKDQLENNWIIPVNKSWLAPKIANAQLLVNG